MISKPLMVAAALVMAAWAGAVSAQDMPGGSDIARRALHVCAACHGEGGRSKASDAPSLAGQPALYTIRQLRDFRSQQRAEADTAAYMWGVSALLDDDTIKSLADYYAAQAPHTGWTKAKPELLRQGKDIFENGLPGKGVRACASCHGDNAEGASGFPRLAGQYADYLYRQMKVFSTRLRPHGVLMKAETSNMSPLQLKAVAAYLQSM
jgi:cytochrome c553